MNTIHQLAQSLSAADRDGTLARTMRELQTRRESMNATIRTALLIGSLHQLGEDTGLARIHMGAGQRAGQGLPGAVRLTAPATHAGDDGCRTIDEMMALARRVKGAA